MKRLKPSLKYITSLTILTFMPGLLFAVEASPDVVAMVNNVAISDAELSVLIEARSKHSMVNMSEDGKLSKAQQQKLIDDLVLAEILVQEASKTGLDKLPTTVAEAAIQYKTLLGQMFLREKVANMQVSEEEIRNRYDAIPAAFKYGLRAINVATQEEVAQLLTQLNEGAEFEILANSYTRENGKSDGGWLGWLRSGQMNVQQLEAVQNLKVATFTTEPVKTRAGWRLLYLEGKKELDKTPYNRSRDWLRDEIQQLRVQALLAELRQNADIEIFQPKLP